MTRSWSAGARSALDASNVALLFFVQADFASGSVRLCTAPYDVQWDGQTWTGLGSILSIGTVGETTDIEAQGLALQLSGVNDALLALAYNSDYQGRLLQLWAAPLADPLALTDVRRIWVGYLDTMSVDDGEMSITLEAEHALARLQRPPGGTYNDADQQSRFAGDRGLEFVAALEKDTEIRWGQAS